MSLLNNLWGVLKKSVIIILIVAITIPLYYGSTNYKYVGFRLLHSMLSLKHSLIRDEARPTLSAEYRAFENILRMKPLIAGDPTEDPLILVKKIRSGSSINTIIPKPPQCQIKKEIFLHDGHTVDTYWVENSGRNFQRHADHMILYFHGGGYMLGDIHSYSGIECHLSQLFNVTILHVEYRLSPEHRLPAAVDDTIAVYQALLRDNIAPSQLLIMGDSAGGGLSLLTIQALIARQLSVPRGVIVLSPWTDLSSSGESHTRNRHLDVMLHSNNYKQMIELLLDPNNSQLSFDSFIISPLFGSFKGFPPMYINVGTAEILEDDSRRVLNKAREAGVDVTFEEGLHLMHVYPAFFHYYPEARNTLDNINRWIRTIFNKKLTK